MITGTPPNLVVLSTLDSDYGSGKAIIFILRHNVETGFVAGDHPMSYATWMAFCVPLMLVNTVIAWLMILVIQRLTLGREEEEKGNQERIKRVIANKKKMLGRMTQHEWQVVLLFLALILLWFFQSPKFMDGKKDPTCCSQL